MTETVDPKFGGKIVTPPTYFNYRYNWTDGVKDLARRYFTTVQAFRMGDCSLKTNKLSEPDWVQYVRDNRMTLEIPVNEEVHVYHWEDVPCGPDEQYKNLNQLVQAANRVRGKIHPQLTTQDLWDSVMNCSVRSSFVEGAIVDSAGKPRLANTTLMKQCREAPLTFSQTYVIRVPFPKYKGTVGVVVTPGSPSTLTAPPKWLEELGVEMAVYDHDIVALRKANAECEAHRAAAVRDLYTLYTLNWLFLRMFDYQCRIDPNEVDLDALIAAQVGDGAVEVLKTFRDLYKHSLENIGTDPARYLGYDSYRRRKTYGERVEARASSPDWKKRVAQAITDGGNLVVAVYTELLEDADRGTVWVSLSGYLTLLELKGHEAGRDSYQADAAVKRSEAALAQLGKAKVTDTRTEGAGETALAQLISLVDTSAKVFAVAAGNLPGPQSLGMAVVASLAAYVAPALPASKGMLGVARPDLLNALGKFADMNDKELKDFTRLLAEAKDRKELEKLGNDLADKFYGSAGYDAALTLIALFSLHTLATSDEPSEAWSNATAAEKMGTALDALAGSGTAALGVASMISKLKPELAWSKALASEGGKNAMLGAGRVVAVLGILKGGISACQFMWEDRADWSYEEMYDGGLQVLSGALSLAGCLFAVPGLQLLGTAVAFVSIIGGGASKLLEWTTPGPQWVTLGTIKLFGEKKPYVVAAMKKKSFKTKYDAFRVAAEDYDCFKTLDPCGGKTEVALRKMGFNTKDVDWLLDS